MFPQPSIMSLSYRNVKWHLLIMSRLGLNSHPFLEIVIPKLPFTDASFMGCSESKHNHPYGCDTEKQDVKVRSKDEKKINVSKEILEILHFLCVSFTPKWGTEFAEESRPQNIAASSTYMEGFLPLSKVKGILFTRVLCTPYIVVRLICIAVSDECRLSLTYTGGTRQIPPLTLNTEPHD